MQVVVPLPELLVPDVELVPLLDEEGVDEREIALLPSSQDEIRLSSARYNGSVLIPKAPSSYFIGKNGLLQKFLMIM